MDEHNDELTPRVDYPVSIHVRPAIEGRNRLTAFFRFFLALPHIILVGGPVAFATMVSYQTDSSGHWEYGSNGGLLGAVVAIATLFAWLSILFAGRHPDGLWKLSAFYMRWRIKATAYLTLLRDEYPPFGDGEYPAWLEASKPDGPRNRLTVFFRPILAIPHIIVLAFLSIAWAFSTALGWASILIMGRYPEPLYGFAIGVWAWSTRVEAYVLLLRDEYPPFTLRA